MKKLEMESLVFFKAVYNSWIKTHTFYENYDDITGKGVMNNPFNGWTSTILLILSENYD